jgi:LemA protein
VSVGLIIVIAALVLIAAFVGLTYNRMVAKRQATENSWAQIDVALKRRHDLIPTLVEAVKGYASHESGTFENIAQARATAVADSNQAPPQRAVAEDTLKQATDRLMVVAENYPQLQATQNFSQLADNLRETEDQIAITRRVYNDTVETYNTLIQVFPAVIVAKLFGFQRREFFEAPAGSEATPEVDLSAAAPPPAPGPA